MHLFYRIANYLVKTQPESYKAFIIREEKSYDTELISLLLCPVV